MGTPLEVTEWMRGYIGMGATDVDAGFAAGIDANTRFEHEVVIKMDDIDRFISEPTHAATMVGHVQCEALGGRRELVNGTFNMLVDAPAPGLKLMFYRMPLTDGRGPHVTVLGHKTIHDDHSLDLWSDITTLAVQVFEGDVAGPEIATAAMGPANAPLERRIAAGKIHIETSDGFRSARSFRAPGASKGDAILAVEKFVSFYLSHLWTVFAPFQRVRS
jgi:cholesterol oxidase